MIVVNMNEKVLKHQKISWISRLLNSFSVHFGINVFLSSVIVFGIIPWIPWFIIMYLTSYYHNVYNFILGSIPYTITLPTFFSFIWVFIGPYLIYKYENHVLPLFLFNSKRLCNRITYNKLLGISSQYVKHSKQIGLIIFPLTILLGYYVFPYAKINFSVNEIYHPYYIFSVLLIGFAMYIGSYGIYGVINSLRLIHHFSKCKLSIDITDPTNKGGYGFIVNFTSKTTFLFSSGFTVIPFLYNISVWISGFGKILGLLLVLFYLCIVISSFFIPFFYFSSIIRQNRNTILKEYLAKISDQYQFSLHSSEYNKNISEVDFHLITWYINRLYCIDGLTLNFINTIQILLSVIIPILITYIQYRLS